MIWLAAVLKVARFSIVPNIKSVKLMLQLNVAVVLPFVLAYTSIVTQQTRDGIADVLRGRLQRSLGGQVGVEEIPAVIGVIHHQNDGVSG